MRLFEISQVHMRISHGVSILLAGVILPSFPTTARAVAWTFDSVTYTPPEGFLPITGVPADRAYWRRADRDKYCEIGVFWAVDESTNAAADHARQWSRLADALLHTGPGTQPSVRTLPSGAQMVASAGRGTLNGAPVVATLFTVRGAGRVTPILILTPTPEALQAYGPAIEHFASSLIAHAAWQRPPNLPPDPLKVRISDLAGVWQRGSANVMTFVNSWGAVTGSNTAFFNEVVTVASDGSYESSTAGMNGGRVIRERITGRWALDGEFLVVTQSGHSTKRLRLALLLEGSDGTVIGLAPEGKAVSLSTISGAGEFWARRKASR